MINMSLILLRVEIPGKWNKEITENEVDVTFDQKYGRSRTKRIDLNLHIRRIWDRYKIPERSQNVSECKYNMRVNRLYHTDLWQGILFYDWEWKWFVWYSDYSEDQDELKKICDNLQWEAINIIWKKYDL